MCGEAKRLFSIQANNLAVPKKTEPGSRQFKVRDRVAACHIVDATAKSVIERTGGLVQHRQVDYGHDQTGLVSEWQVV